MEDLLYEVREGTHVYCCGPQGLMHAVSQATAHWPGTCVHFEYFSAPAAVWPRLLVDLLFSQVVLAFVTPWFFALQARSLAIAQVMTAAYERRFNARRM